MGGSKQRQPQSSPRADAAPQSREPRWEFRGDDLFREWTQKLSDTISDAGNTFENLRDLTEGSGDGGDMQEIIAGLNLDEAVILSPSITIDSQNRVRLSITTAILPDIAVGPVTAERVTLQKLSLIADTTKRGEISGQLSIGEVMVRGLTVNDQDLGDGSVEDLQIWAEREAMGEASVRLEAGTVDTEGVDASNVTLTSGIEYVPAGPGTEVQSMVPPQLSAEDLDVDLAGIKATAGTLNAGLSAQGVSLDAHNVDVDGMGTTASAQAVYLNGLSEDGLASGSAHGVEGTTTLPEGSSASGPGVDIPDLIRSAGPMIEDADVQVEVARGERSRLGRAIHGTDQKPPMRFDVAAEDGVLTRTDADLPLGLGVRTGQQHEGGSVRGLVSRLTPRRRREHLVDTPVGTLGRVPVAPLGKTANKIASGGENKNRGMPEISLVSDYIAGTLGPSADGAPSPTAPTPDWHGGGSVKAGAGTLDATLAQVTTEATPDGVNEVVFGREQGADQIAAQAARLIIAHIESMAGSASNVEVEDAAVQAPLTGSGAIRYSIGSVSVEDARPAR